MSLPDTAVCAIHSIAHVTGKSLDDVWSVAKRYWRRNYGLNQYHINLTLQELGYIYGKARTDLTLVSGRRPLTKEELVEKLSKENTPLLIQTRNHSMAWNKGQLLDIADKRGDTLVGAVYEVERLNRFNPKPYGVGT